MCKSRMDSKNIKKNKIMITAKDLLIDVVRVSECMLNAAEDMISTPPNKNTKIETNRILRISTSYEVRDEGVKVVLFSSQTRYIISMSKKAYLFLKDIEGKNFAWILNNISDEIEVEKNSIKDFLDELDSYKLFEAA